MTEEKTKPEPTERVLLKRERVDTSDDGTPRWMDVWVPILGDDGELRIFRAASKKAAMEQYAGKKGKDHPGTYRAPSLRSWREEHEFEPDPEPTMRETIRP